MIIAYNGHGIFLTLLWMILWIFIKLVVNIYRIKIIKPDDDRIILNTLPISHYVEKVRWCLDKSGLNYEEEKDVGILGIITTGRSVPTFKIPKHDISISNSSDILKYLYGHLLTQDEDRSKFLQPSPKSRELEAQIDRMGYNLRTYLYYHILVANKNIENVALKGWGIHDEEIPPWQKAILKVAWPLLRKFLIKVLDVTKENADACLKKAEEFFEQTDKMLAKNQYLMGTEEPTYIDISFASLAGIYSLTDQYGGPRAFPSPDAKLKLSDFTLEVQNKIKKFRKTSSGLFIQRMYSEHR